MKALAHLLFIVSLLLGTGCASIVSQSKWSVYVDSEPPGAQVDISDREGKQVYQGTTPATVNLRSGAGFFTPQRYSLVFKREGYETNEAVLNCKVNPWYYGNILIGGLVGMVIVDPLTGAMFKPETEQLNVHLHKRDNQEPKYINTMPNDVHSGK